MHVNVCPSCNTPCTDTYCSDKCRKYGEDPTSWHNMQDAFIISLSPERLALYNNVNKESLWISDELWQLHLLAKYTDNCREIRERIEMFANKTPFLCIEPLMEWNDQGMALHAEIDAEIKRQKSAKEKAA